MLFSIREKLNIFFKLETPERFYCLESNNCEKKKHRMDRIFDFKKKTEID